MVTTWLRQWLQVKSLTPRRRHGTRRMLAFRPRLECFESRIVPAVRTWDSLTCFSLDAKWSNKDNWSGNVAPVNGDDVIFPNADGVRRSTHNDIPNLVLNSITFAGGPDTSFCGENQEYSISGDLPNSTLGIGAGGIQVTLPGIAPVILHNMTLSGTTSKPFSINNASSSL